MAYGIRITGLAEAQRLLGADFTPALRSATRAVALEVQGEIAPYPPATEANSPDNPKGRWYERGYGTRWWRKNTRKQTTVSTRFGRVRVEYVTPERSMGGSKTSQMLGRSWSIRRQGDVGQVLGNRATYAKYVHGAGTQATYHARRHWVTDATAVGIIVQSGVVRRIVKDAIVGALRRRR